MARTPDLLAAVGHVLLPAGADPSAGFSGLRLVPGLLELADDDVASAIWAALNRWGAGGSGAVLPVAETGPIDPDLHRSWLRAFQAIQGREAWAGGGGWKGHGGWVGRHWGDLAPDVAGRFRAASAYTAEEEAAARGLAAEARRAVRALVGDGILVVPSAASVAPLAKDSAAGGAAIERQRERTMLLTCLAGLGGLPVVNVPLETAAGLPCGVSLVGAAGSDAALLSYALRLGGVAA
jgi:Asp-tRNA(Asn)/Glu-tRNA(Gln) amidotransferase A subunit family amidase